MRFCLQAHGAFGILIGMDTKEKRPVGRPSSYTRERGVELCALFLEGCTIKEICARDDMPVVTTFFRWLQDFPEFQQLYAHTKELQAEIMASEIQQIADDGTNDWMERELQNGRTVTVFNHEHAQRSKLRVEARKWLLSKTLPKRYGDRIIHAGDENAPLATKDLTNPANARQALEHFVHNYANRVPLTADGGAGKAENYDDLC